MRPMSVPRPPSYIQTFHYPLYPSASLAVLRGNLAPGGAIIKASASKWKKLLKHSDPAVVFYGSADMARRLDDLNFDVTENSVLVLQNIGLIGNPGMPKVGMIPIPRKLASRGVLDMLRISDGRMSGTAGGSIILHVSPEAADPSSVLGVVRDGDIITCDVETRSLQVEIPDEDIQRRIAERKAGIERSRTASVGEERPSWVTREKMRGYRGLYMRSVLQSQQGADFDFLTAEGP